VAKSGPRFNCSKCKLGRHCDTDRKLPKSNGPATYNAFSFPDIGFESKTCPLPLITALSTKYIKLYFHYSNGVLLKGGGIDDQPQQYIEAMEIIGAHA